MHSRRGRRGWNVLVKCTVENGVHVICMDGFDRQCRTPDMVSRNFYLNRHIAVKIEAEFSVQGEAKTDAGLVRLGTVPLRAACSAAKNFRPARRLPTWRTATSGGI